MNYNLLEQMERNVKVHPTRVLLADDKTPGVTCSQVQMISGRVYRYLKEHNIGREDFVMICLPRGVRAVLALYGVLRSGAAFVIVEENYAPERIEYIRKDCNCKLVINHTIWEEIQHIEPLEGYEPFEEHAAAFAVYTSGTTGNPKGVLHEYGNIMKIIESAHIDAESAIITGDDRFALVAPLNFVASMVVLLAGLYGQTYVYIVSYAVLKNPVQLDLFLVKHQITNIFLPPSYLRRLKKNPGLLHKIRTGSEVASNIYLEGCEIYNCYAMSETGFLAACFLIDHEYDVTPVGTAMTECAIVLLDENGKEVSGKEAGEICVENPYVRGYINLPEETARAFQNGYYHTGDLGKYDERGNLIVVGRLNDMVKVNGNRVEPGEIEHIARKVLGVEWAAARIFTEKEKVYICVYYLEDRKVDPVKTQKEMEKYLPYYMIPSFFIHIDEVPLRPNGKMDRRALPAPQFEKYREDYVAPLSVTEKALCYAFEKVLKLDHIGIRDDFYLLGGDSLGTMEVIKESGLKNLSASDIYQGRTPEKIAAIYQENQLEAEGISLEEKEEKARRKVHKLTTEQTYAVDYQLYSPKSTMYNLFEFLRFEKEAMDAEILTNAVNKTIKNHPALLTIFSFNEDGVMVQRYHPELFMPVQVEKISEAEMSTYKDELVQPFKIFGAILYRARIFETETALYFFFDVHHAVFDGTSYGIFFRDLLSVYKGIPLQKDYYYSTIQNRQDQEHAAFYLESKKYFEKRYDGINWDVYPMADFESKKTDMGELCQKLSISGAELQQKVEQLEITKNEFFIAVTILAVSFYNQHENVKISWIHNGRENAASMNSIGMLFRDLPVAVKVVPSLTVESLLESIKEQVLQGIAHSIYPYIEKNADAVVDDVACVLYQGAMHDISIGSIPLEEVPVRQNYVASQSILDMEIWDLAEGLELVFQYTSNRYKESSMACYMDLYCRLVEELSKDGAASRTVEELKEKVTSVRKGREKLENN